MKLNPLELRNVVGGALVYNPIGYAAPTNAHPTTLVIGHAVIVHTKLYGLAANPHPGYL